MPRSSRELQLIRESIEDLKLAIQREAPPPSVVEQSVKSKRRPPEKTIRYPGTTNTVARTGVITQDTTEVRPAHDLAEVLRLTDIESYFAISIDRHVELIMKRGFVMKGQNPETVAYVKRRIREIGLISDQPFEDSMRQVVRDVVACSNAYLVIYRDGERSTGLRTRMWGRERDPVAGLSVADPTTVLLKQTRSGRPSLYVQRVPGHRDRSWPHHDVVHITWRKKSGSPFGTPFVIPALEDIRALRKLEMVAEHVSHKYAFPMMHWKVGSEKIPAGKVTDHASGAQVAEVEIASQYAESLAQEGFVVTSERHEIKIVGAEGETLDLQPFIEHYEMRVIAGLRLSMMDLGRGDTANRGTASVLSQILVDSCTEIQSVISTFMTERFIDHLVMEGGYNLTDENRVHFVFPAIDTVEERAHQMHGLQMYVQGGITQSEFRQGYMHLDELSDDQEENMFLYEHLIPLAEAQAEAKAAAAPAVDNANRPENQHGKSETAPKRPANDDELKTKISTIWDRCSQAVIAYIDQKNARDVRPAFAQAFRDMSTLLEVQLHQDWRAGFTKAYADAKKEPPTLLSDALTNDELHQVDKLLLAFKSKDLQQVQSCCMVQSDIEQRTGLARSAGASTFVVPAFESTKALIDIKLDRIRTGAKIIGYLHGQKAMGRTTIKLGSEDTGHVLEFSDMIDRPDLVRPLALTKRLQDAMISVFVNDQELA